MILDNKQIEEHVMTILKWVSKEKAIPPASAPVIKAGTELIINFLQNINTIAYNSDGG